MPRLKERPKNWKTKLTEESLLLLNLAITILRFIFNNDLRVSLSNSGYLLHKTLGIGGGILVFAH